MKFTLTLFCCLFYLQLSAQSFENKIRETLTQKNLLTNTDFVISSESKSAKSGVSHVYVQQTHQKIKIYNAVGDFHFDKSGQLFLFHQNFVSNIQINTSTPNISPIDAISKVAKHLGVNEVIPVLRKEFDGKYYYSCENLAKSEIPVELCWVKNDNQLVLAWDLSVQQKGSSDWWSIRLNANSGEILNQNNWTVYCPAHKGAYQKCEKRHVETNPVAQNKTNSGAQYNVFAMPAESPNHGPRVLLIDPQDSLASPYGWHDIDGDGGADLTITQGNNVHAYEDTLSQDAPGYSPDGGLSLNFNFPLNFNAPPTTNLDASITNLFYMNNIMHDVWYHYGFDEQSGNFQYNNYARGGSENDYVFAEGMDGGGTNNANFATPNDGQNPTMQMYLWNPGFGLQTLLTVESPATIDGPYTASEATFGPSVPYSPLTAEVVLATDNTTPFNDICTPITNASAVSGKIALIDRGTCTFVSKVTEAQNAGAVAVIIINNVGGQPITMGGTGAGGITIPVIMLSQTNGNLIKTQLNNGQTVIATLQKTVSDFDCDYDNGVIAHEYGHGISNRLTGGRFNSNCLTNDEQMGEGWSDWFAMVLTMEPGDQGTDARGMATYVNNEPITGGGIREAPYSTNFSVNGYTYADVAGGVSLPHGIGFVWATMLWEMTWDLIDQYGYDSDLYNGTGGNNMAMHLVIEGLKLQPCSPGFIDGRDAILAADQQLYGGANQCLIWKAFARRGLGENADQGSSSSRSDQIEDFTVPASCLVTSKDQLATQQIFVFPNPSNGQTSIKISNPVSQDLDIQVINLEGKTIYQSKLNVGQTEHSIKLSDISAGVYAIHVKGNGIFSTQKWVVKP